MKKNLSFILSGAFVFGLFIAPSANAAGRGDMYKNYNGCGDVVCDNSRVAPVPVRTAVRPAPVKSYTAPDTLRKDAGDKYYLADPFFQPRAGNLGSVTDIAYNSNSYNYKIANSLLTDDAGKWSATAITVKEDLSFGITDDLTIIGAAEYIKADYELDWRLDASGVDKDSESKVDMLGAGLMWKFVDNAEWIGHIAGYYQWRDESNTIVMDAKAGYKIDNFTIYGLARAFYINYDSNSYGNGIDLGDQATFFALQTDAEKTWYFEGGLGLFSIMAPDWTLNLEAVFSDYDWHNQASVKAAIGWQPGHSFALNLYAKAAVYDSADSKKDIGVYYWDTLNPDPNFVGTIGISDYSEMQFGLQAILYF